MLLALWLSGCDVVLGIGEVSPLEAPDGGSAGQDVGEPSAMSMSPDAAPMPHVPDAELGADAASPTLAPDAASVADAAATSDAAAQIDATRSDAAFEHGQDAAAPDAAVDPATSDDDGGANDGLP